MQIVAGEYYKTRDGRKVGPMHYSPGMGFSGGVEGEIGGRSWSSTGVHCMGFAHLELIAPWPDEPASPVVTETVKRIKPGTYGIVEVDGAAGRFADVQVRSAMYRASELRAAAKVFTDLADALDERIQEPAE